MTTEPTEHVQTTMLPPEAVKITLRLGLVGATEHGQWQLEVHNATDGTLLDMVSRPHFDTANLDTELDRAVRELRQFAKVNLVPF